MKAIYSKHIFQLILITDMTRPDGQPYVFSTTVGSPNEARRVLQEMGFGIDLEEAE